MRAFVPFLTHTLTHGVLFKGILFKMEAKREKPPTLGGPLRHRHMRKNQPSAKTRVRRLRASQFMLSMRVGALISSVAPVLLALTRRAQDSALGLMESPWRVFLKVPLFCGFKLKPREKPPFAGVP